MTEPTDDAGLAAGAEARARVRILGGSPMTDRHTDRSGAERSGQTDRSTREEHVSHGASEGRNRTRSHVRRPHTLSGPSYPLNGSRKSYVANYSVGKPKSVDIGANSSSEKSQSSTTAFAEVGPNMYVRKIPLPLGRFLAFLARLA